MSDILLADNSLVGSALSDAGLVLFGLLLLLYGAIITLIFLLKMKPDLFLVLSGLLKIQILLLLGIVALDLSGVEPVSASASFPELSAALATHRWLES